MRVIKKLGYASPEELGSDNTLMMNEIGPYLIKDADFAARKIGVPINIYPVTQESTEPKIGGSAQYKLVPVFSATLTEQDYNNVARHPTVTES